ncbi:hypothetical protein M0813_23385 [Anaeramoeba flamelloides]|uniref:Phosphatidic acid phosphatase type 2/haloperoxidase domain-containing protein n=1 Tax=Anaeramoeba flamelloides TaxID=1746091 RepID=A0ABQ8Y9D2_9EUKA|nr:hypothetical protein M0813_23385 [Anaeramoeba flamelloides]
MLKTSLLCILIFLISLHTAECSQYCQNVNGDMFLNKCFKDQTNGFWSLLADTIKWWVNPRTDAIILSVIILGLPFMMFGTKKRVSVSELLYSKYISTKFALLNLLHRICYALVLDIVLLSVFRQRRPCKCDLDGSGNYVHIGSIYGMPSAEAMNGALVAISIFDFAPINVAVSRIFSALILLIVMAERVALGYHTIGQVTVGASIGVALHFCSTRLPQWFNFADSVVQFILSWWVLLLDNESIKVERGSLSNQYAWVMWGNSFLLIEFFLSFRMWSKVIGWKQTKFSYSSILQFLNQNKKKLYTNAIRSKTLIKEISTNQNYETSPTDFSDDYFTNSSDLSINQTSNNSQKEKESIPFVRGNKQKISISHISDFWFNFVVILVFGFGFLFFQTSITQYAYPV